jgi:DNA (cytosine-5)-methyltransferase 1
MGYHRAGFDVVGVDIAPQPRYPFEFHQADAMTWPLDGYDAIHASPPCQDHMRKHVPAALRPGNGWMLPATRARLQQAGVPWIIENVPGAEMRVDFKLCGCMFGLPRLRRERWFETSPQMFDLRPPCHHTGLAIGVTGTGPGRKGEKRIYGDRWPTMADWRAAMGIDWMRASEMTQAIPPAYTEYIGRHLLAALERAA